MTQTLKLIPETSEAYVTMEYQIQQLIKAPRVKIIEAFDINNVNQALQFSKCCEEVQPRNVVHAFIPTMSLQQPLADIVKNGVRISPNIPLHIFPDKILAEKDKDLNEVIHALVLLGNTFNFQNPIDDFERAEFINREPNHGDIPEDYDSLCVNPGEFIVFKPEQIRTLHLIRFSSGKTLELAKESEHYCNLCNAKATLWCSNCAAKLCGKCDEQSHKVNKVLELHKRVPINEAYSQMTECSVHSGVKVEHFCFQCQIPVCIECKMSGNHSMGNASRHALIPLKDAYSAAIKHTDTEDRIYIRRRKALNEKRRDYLRRLNDVIENEKVVRARILKVTEDALRSLKEQAGERALKLRSTITEVDRKLKEIDDKKDFLLLHRDYSDPVTFIKKSCIHDRLLQELKHDDDIPLDCEIEGDLTLAGGLTVCPKSETNIPPGKKVRDLNFDERERITDFPTETTTITETVYTDESYQTEPPKEKFDISKIKLTKISALASRKMQKLRKAGKEIDFQPFAGSKILDREQGVTLYHAFPFKAAPKTHMLFSSERDGKSIRIMHNLIDGLGITAVIIKRDSFIFGGFAGTKWNHNGENFGTPNSTFLFSLNRDAIIPYKPSIEEPYVLFAEGDSLTFGRYDLVLADNFKQCVAVIENSYGIGLPPNSQEAETYLAGVPEFAADIVEVWGFFTDDDK